MWVSEEKYVSNERGGGVSVPMKGGVAGSPPERCTNWVPPYGTAGGVVGVSR